MFTGLIADLGDVRALKRDADGATVEITTSLAAELAEGDSIAVNGVCLTATAIDAGPRALTGAGAGTATGGGDGALTGARSGGGAGSFRAQAMEETLRRTSLGALEPGGKVNLELAMRLGDRLGGHIVQGHVDGVGTIVEIKEEGFSRAVSVEVPADLVRHLVEKGSVALDGVSLTVSAVEGDRLTVSLIPETLSRTTLGLVTVGTRVNVEVDILGKHVERLLATTLTRR